MRDIDDEIKERKIERVFGNPPAHAVCTCGETEAGREIPCRLHDYSRRVVAPTLPKTEGKYVPRDRCVCCGQKTVRGFGGCAKRRDAHSKSVLDKMLAMPSLEPVDYAVLNHARKFWPLFQKPEYRELREKLKDFKGGAGRGVNPAAPSDISNKEEHGDE